MYEISFAVAVTIFGVNLEHFGAGEVPSVSLFWAQAPLALRINHYGNTTRKIFTTNYYNISNTNNYKRPETQVILRALDL